MNYTLGLVKAAGDTISQLFQKASILRARDFQVTSLCISYMYITHITNRIAQNTMAYSSLYHASYFRSLFSVVTIDIDMFVSHIFLFC